MLIETGIREVGGEKVSRVSEAKMGQNSGIREVRGQGEMDKPESSPIVKSEIRELPLKISGKRKLAWGEETSGRKQQAFPYTHLVKSL